MKRVITAEHVHAAHAAGQRQLEAPRRETLVTPEAWSVAAQLGVAIDQDAAPDPPMPDTRPPDPGSSAREVDASGVVVVRGGSIRLGRFDGAGPDRDVRLTDILTARDGSPMTAGVMAWQRKDSFPWALDYDEVDLVLEGVLHIVVDGRVVEGRAGDVVYIPKGSRIEFATPSRVRVFYVTYPADWAAASAGLAGRPVG